jgi:dTDP-4-amino-4,6-dideoxygalactose transaminase
VAALGEIASRRGLRLLYDAAHAFGCTVGGRMIGGFGDAEVFSFHATKFLNSGEGGAVATNDDAVLRKFADLRNHRSDRAFFILADGVANAQLFQMDFDHAVPLARIKDPGSAS